MKSALRKLHLALFALLAALLVAGLLILASLNLMRVGEGKRDAGDQPYSELEIAERKERDSE
jgi:hypothetical protein